MRQFLCCVLLAALPFPSRAELEVPAYYPLPVGRIAARGWIKEQLEIQLHGLGGHLHHFYDDIRHSTWLGGNATESGGARQR